MANINLGNIRRLGFIKGLADSELARQAAQAKIAEEDRAYQRLLKRDEETRAFQAAESAKGRELTRERMAYEAEDRAATAAFRTQQLEYQEEAKIRDEKRQKEQEDYRREQREVVKQSNTLQAIANNFKSADTVISQKQIEELSARFPLVPGASHIIEGINVHARAAEQETIKANAKNMVTLIHSKDTNISPGSVSEEQITQYAKQNDFFKRFLTREGKPDIGAFDRYLKQQNKIKRFGKINTKVQPRTVGTTLDGGEIQITQPTVDEYKKRVDRKTNRIDQITEALAIAVDQDRQIKEFYSKDSTLFTEDNKQRLQDVYGDIVSKFASGFQKMDGSGKGIGTRSVFSDEIILNKMPYLKQLIKDGIVDKKQIMDRANIFDPKSDQITNATIGKRTGEIISQRVPNGETITDSPFQISVPLRASIKGVPTNSVTATFLTDVNKFRSSKEYADNPEIGNRIIERSTLFREWHDAGYTGTKDGVNYEDLLLKTLTNGAGELNPDASTILNRAVVMANPEMIYKINTDYRGAGGKLYDGVKNPNIQMTDEADKIVLNAADAIRETEEVTRLAESIKIMGRQLHMQGMSSDVAGFIDRTGYQFKTVPDAIISGVKEVARSFGFKNKDKVIESLEEMQSQSRATYSSRGIGKAGEGGTDEEKVRIRNGIIQRAQDAADRDLKVLNDMSNSEFLSKHPPKNSSKMNQQQLNEYVTRAKIDRQRIILKKIALTYRMSGLLQGDSSGRTISNADFDVALRALWGEAYAVEAKMNDIIKFFEYRKNIAVTNRDYAKSGLLTPMSKINEALNRKISKDFETKLNESEENRPSFRAGAQQDEAASKAFSGLGKQKYQELFQNVSKNTAENIKRNFGDSIEVFDNIRRPSDFVGKKVKIRGKELDLHNVIGNITSQKAAYFLLTLYRDDPDNFKRFLKTDRNGKPVRPKRGKDKKQITNIPQLFTADGKKYMANLIYRFEQDLIQNIKTGR